MALASSVFLSLGKGGGVVTMCGLLPVLDGTSQSVRAWELERLWSCCVCAKAIFHRDALIALPDPSMGWQGVLPMLCRECHNMIKFNDVCVNEWVPDPKRWRKTCRAAWVQRRRPFWMKYVTMRRTYLCHPVRLTKGRFFQKAVRRYRRTYEGHLKKRLARSHQGRGDCALAIVVGVFDLPETVRMQMEAAIACWDADWKAKIFYSGNELNGLPELASIELFEHEAQLLSAVVDQVDEFYVCRQRACLYIGRNTDWVTNVRDGGWHFLCPICGEQYKPWSMKPGYIQASKVLVIPGPKWSQYIMRPKRMSSRHLLLPCEFDHEDSDDEWQVIPFIWQDTATQTLMNRWKEITSEICLRIEDWPLDKRIDLVMEHVKQRPVPRYFRRLQLTQKALDSMNACNQQHPRRPQFSVDHIDDGMVWGTLLKEHPSFVLPLTQQDVFRMWSPVSWILEEAPWLE